MNRTFNYKTIQGLLRQSQYNQISLSNIISHRFFHKKHGWVSFKLSNDTLKEFTDGICAALNMRDKDIVYYNIINHRVGDCGILERCIAQTDKKSISFSYCAGQDYPSETRLVRKLLRCK